VVVLGYEIARLKISENMDEDELKVALDGITSEIPDLRQRLIENFIRMLVARVLPKASERIITALRRKDIPEDVLDSLMFSIEDLGYERRHWETEEEAEWGFPILALEISIPEGLELLLPMDLSNIDNPVDVEKAVQRLSVALRKSHTKT